MKPWHKVLSLIGAMSLGGFLMAQSVFPPAGGSGGAAATAVALASNGANCTTGNYPLGVDASGSSETCTAVPITKPALTDSIQLVSINGNDANDGLSWGTAKLTISAALTALSATGGKISIGCGTFPYSSTLTISNPGTILSGSGWGYVGATPSCTVLRPSAGTVGLTVSAQYAIVENLAIDSAAVALGTDDCLAVTGAAFTGRNLMLSNCGRRGVNIADSVLWNLDTIYTFATREDGIRISGISGSGLCNSCSATNSVGGWGINSLSGNDVFVNSYVQANASGGINANAPGDVWIGTAVDAGVGSTFILGASSNKNQFSFQTYALPTTFTDNGTANLGTTMNASGYLQTMANNKAIQWPTAAGTLAIAAAGTTAATTCTNQVVTAISTSAAPTCTALTTAFLPAAATLTIANGTSDLGTSAISSGACATVVTTSATGTATTDNIQADFNADPTGVTGYAPSASGMLTIIKYPTTNNVNYKVCNNTAGSITPGAITLNWRVVR